MIALAWHAALEGLAPVVSSGRLDTVSCCAGLLY